MAAPGIWTGSHAATGWRLSTAEPQPTHAPVGVLTHDGATHELRTFPSDASGSIRLAIDDDEFTVELLDVGANALLVAAGGRSLALRHSVDASGAFVSGPGFETRVDIAPFVSTASAGVGASSRNLAAPMTGQVPRILVEVGDAVEEGDVVAVMESMKLELQLPAQHAGTIVSINCAVGSIVDRGVAVAEIDHGSHLLTVCQWQGLERLSGLPQPRQLAPLRRSTRLDGNKRLGWLATAVFLELNGQTPSKVSNEAVYELVCAVAAGDFTVDEIASLIRAAAEDV